MRVVWIVGDVRYEGAVWRGVMCEGWWGVRVGGWERVL